MLPPAVLTALCCPVCDAGLTASEQALTCESGHAFDIARQGYVNLRTGRRPVHTGDTTDMVAARAEFLAAGHYAPIVDAVVRAVGGAVGGIGQGPGERAGLVLDIGGGTGHYLARVLDAHPGAWGVTADVSRAALRRSARAHPRVVAVGADVWQGIPQRTGTVSAVLDVFAPRNAAEFHRVLRPAGVLVVVTPAAEHLRELVGTLDLLGVDELKDERVEQTLGDRFVLDGRDDVTFELRLGADDVARLVRMGPSGHHLGPAELAARITGVTLPETITAAVTVARYRPCGGA